MVNLKEKTKYHKSNKNIVKSYKLLLKNLENSIQLFANYAQLYSNFRCLIFPKIKGNVFR